MSHISIDFSWSPISVPISFTAGGNTYPYTHQSDAVSRGTDSRYVSYTTPNHTLLTFVASTVIPSGLAIIEYKWNFGDGSVGYGSTVTHTYRSASPQTQATLTIVDNLGQRKSVGRLLNLREASPILIGQGIAVG